MEIKIKILLLFIRACWQLLPRLRASACHRHPEDLVNEKSGLTGVYKFAW